MKRKRLLAGMLALALVAAAALALWQIGRHTLNTIISASPGPTMPARLVTQIHVATYPVEPENSRCYTAQEDVTRLLRLLRTASAGELLTEAPSLETAEHFHVVTLTYAGGSTTLCYLVEDRCFRQDDGDWHELDRTLVATFHEFLKTHPGIPAQEEPSPSEPTTA